MMDSERININAEEAAATTAPLKLDDTVGSQRPDTTTPSSDHDNISDTSNQNTEQETLPRRSIRRSGLKTSPNSSFRVSAKDLASAKRAVPIQNLGRAATAAAAAATSSTALAASSSDAKKDRRLKPQTNHYSSDDSSTGSSDNGDLKSPAAGADPDLERILYLPEKDKKEKTKKKSKYIEESEKKRLFPKTDNYATSEQSNNVNLAERQTVLQLPPTTTPVGSSENSVVDESNKDDESELLRFQKIDDVEHYWGMNTSTTRSLWMTDGGGTRQSPRRKSAEKISFPFDSSFSLPFDVESSEREEHQSDHDNGEQEYGNLLPSSSEAMENNDDDGSQDFQVFGVTKTNIIQNVKRSLERWRIKMMNNKQRRKRGSLQEFFNDADGRFSWFGDTWFGDGKRDRSEPSSSYRNSHHEYDGDESDSLFPASTVSDQIKYLDPKYKRYRYNICAQCRASCWSKLNRRSRILFYASFFFIVLSMFIIIIHGNNVKKRNPLSKETNTAVMLPPPTISPSPSASPSMSHSPDYHTISPQPTKAPTSSPTVSSIPSNVPSFEPTMSSQPSNIPSSAPSASSQPSDTPSIAPSTSSLPSSTPSTVPTTSIQPSDQPSSRPTVSQVPSAIPSARPTVSPQPSNSPTDKPVRKGRKPPQLPVH